MTIRIKIIVSFCIICTLITIIFSSYIYYYYADYRRDLFKEILFSKSATIANFFFQGYSDEKINRIVDQADILNLYNEKILLLDEKNEIQYTNIDRNELKYYLNFAGLNRMDGKPVYLAEGPVEITVCNFSNKNKEYIAINSGIDLLGNNKLQNLASILIMGNTFAFFVSLFFGIIFSENILKPISKIIRQVDAVSEYDLTSQIDEGNRKDEIARLASNYNRLFKRVQKVFINQKNFISHASHELRTPLATVLSRLEDTLLHPGDLETTQQSIKKSIEDLKKSIDLTNGLLHLATINKELTITPDKIRVDEIVLNEITKIKAHYPSQVISFNILEVPEIENPYVVTGNSILLSIAIYNLIDNACKYANNDKILIDISMNKDLETRITITDFGIGIKETDHPFIFEPLYRGSNVYEYKGFGIGLSLVNRIILLHNGEIAINSKVGEGTTVILSLPPST